MEIMNSGARRRVFGIQGRGDSREEAGEEEGKVGSTKGTAGRYVEPSNDWEAGGQGLGPGLERSPPEAGES